ncbi:hypothetical protein NG799_01755 [Laspinema sp. D1]|uniref:Uncharacterized protein n=1 Tax=Laspinema palackyanum D2a TaxID=2953684 RepID=A0ABT2MMD8_9CYAN|nr:hypothetical protein [Laspinema sp. D2a]
MSKTLSDYRNEYGEEFRAGYQTLAGGGPNNTTAKVWRILSREDIRDSSGKQIPWVVAEGASTELEAWELFEKNLAALKTPFEFDNPGDEFDPNFVWESNPLEGFPPQ